MKQTAVEWLITILERQKDEALSYDEWLIAFEHAKEIEKEQIKFFYKQGHLNLGCPIALEEVYKKTFNKIQ